MKDSNFCHFFHEDGPPVAIGKPRRLSLTSAKDLLSFNDLLHIRAIHIFDKGALPENFMKKSLVKSKHLKVLDFEDTSLNCIPSNLGNLFHLRYLNLRSTKIKVLPKSIGKLINLETLDLKQTLVHELPKEIKNLTKLRYLRGYYRNFNTDYSVLGTTRGIAMRKGIECLTSLQNLSFIEAYHDELDVIQGLKKLTQLRRLGLRRVRSEYGNALCSSIAEMKHLESLNITAISADEFINLNFESTPPQIDGSI
ncbi:hypothetical protein HN51_033312 [Arachis hypogaea]|nr:Disease resistance protein [Arachis hypogaea]